jgi:hypothetical protein
MLRKSPQERQAEFFSAEEPPGGFDFGKKVTQLLPTPKKHKSWQCAHTMEPQ